MLRRHDGNANELPDRLPPLPLPAGHWQAIVRALRLSPRQATIVELTLRGAGNKQIATALGISEPTLKTHQQRICARTETRGRMELALRVLAVSHQVTGNVTRHPKG